MVRVRVPELTAAVVAFNAYVLSRKLLLIVHMPVKEGCQGEAVPPCLTVGEAS